ncbi:hypothetical protein VP01_3730g4 [Puccinia sorghi]|uniref:Uncharacterized protein n=1 Tax=Puccinia sorghi TaxID=27349 RepID=A0A0L6UTZ2_9BASI|nr:hypothetical protein VP01_3730g4 [Puccinia sorghi]
MPQYLATQSDVIVFITHCGLWVWKISGTIKNQPHELIVGKKKHFRILNLLIQYVVVLLGDKILQTLEYPCNTSTLTGWMYTIKLLYELCIIAHKKIDSTSRFPLEEQLAIFMYIWQDNIQVGFFLSSFYDLNTLLTFILNRVFHYINLFLPHQQTTSIQKSNQTQNYTITLINFWAQVTPPMSRPIQITSESLVSCLNDHDRYESEFSHTQCDLKILGDQMIVARDAEEDDSDRDRQLCLIPQFAPSCIVSTSSINQSKGPRADYDHVCLNPITHLTCNFFDLVTFCIFYFFGLFFKINVIPKRHVKSCIEKIDDFSLLEIIKLRSIMLLKNIHCLRSTSVLASWFKFISPSMCWLFFILRKHTQPLDGNVNQSSWKLIVRWIQWRNWRWIYFAPCQTKTPRVCLVYVKDIKQ